MDICNDVWFVFLQLSVLCGKNLALDIAHKLLNHFFFIPAMLVGVIDFYNFMPLSLTFTLPGVTRSVRSKTYELHFLTQFSFDQDEIWCGDEASQAEHHESTFKYSLL